MYHLVFFAILGKASIGGYFGNLRQKYYEVEAVLLNEHLGRSPG